jgi:hypothetical protein
MRNLIPTESFRPSVRMHEQPENSDETFLIKFDTDEFCEKFNNTDLYLCGKMLTISFHENLLVFFVRISSVIRQIFIRSNAVLYKSCRENKVHVFRQFFF